MSNKAWVTLATNDSYGLGALVLAHSLRRVASENPAVVLITPAVTDAMRERLNAVFSEVVVVDVLDSRDAAHLALLQRPELGITFTKIHCWSLTQFEKCVFLDADTLVVQNCDELFEREELSAAPDVGWPDCFNSGVFVFKPSKETFDRLIAFAQERGSFDGGDQGLLNTFFSDWARGDISKHLPFLYNVTSAAFYSYLPALKHFGQDLKIIHFIGAAKPWLQHFNFESRTVDAPDHIRGLLQIWWDIFVGQVHSELDATMVEVDEPPETPPPALPPQDVSQHYHYQPVIDPESEFPWHRPEAQSSNDPERNVQITDIHDRWESYRGNIPPMSEHYSEADVENLEEMRQYAWDYQHQEIVGREHTSSEENNPAPTHTHSYQHNEHQHLEHHSHTENQYFDQHAHSEHNYNQQGTSSYHDQPSHRGHWHHDSADHFHQDDNHHHTQHYDHSQNQTHHTNYQEQSSTNDQSNEYRYDSFSHQPETFYHVVESKTHDIYHHIENLQHDIPIENSVEIHHVHVQPNNKKRRPRRHRIDLGTVYETDTLINGDVSESESDYFEDNIIPRHPYDGFYLRHRSTIDSRGHKVCTHEIPPTPSPTPSPPESSTPQDYDTAEENISSDIEDHSGVAGNLARVVAGGPHDALDDLTRRQGWEAGNIDYMGADSFDNIWAKISQTLTQPRSSPSSPKESPPQEAPVQAAEVVSELVKVAKEAVIVATQAPVAPVPEPAPASEPEPVPAPVEKPIPAPVAEPIPAPVELAPVMTPVEEHTAAPVEKTPVAIPSKVKTLVAPAKVETLVVPIEPAAIEDIPVTVADVPVEEPKTESVEAPPAPKTVIEPSPPTAPTTPKTPEATPVKVALPSCPVATDNILVTDSPPLANTPSKEDAPEVPAAKSEERRKVGKLQLSPPAVADPLPTPDSEAEDASTLAHAIIASELRAIQTPTVTSPETPAEPASPLAPKAGLTVAEPQVPTPPVGSGAVSLAQIGVKPKEKTSTAAQLESSIAAVTDKPEAPKDAPKKKIIKKVVKKVDKEAAAGVDAPVPPPRKKEKKPKEK